MEQKGEGERKERKERRTLTDLEGGLSFIGRSRRRRQGMGGVNASFRACSRTSYPPKSQWGRRDEDTGGRGWSPTLGEEVCKMGLTCSHICEFLAEVRPLGGGVGLWGGDALSCRVKQIAPLEGRRLL